MEDSDQCDPKAVRVRQIAMPPAKVTSGKRVVKLYRSVTSSSANIETHVLATITLLTRDRPKKSLLKPGVYVICFNKQKT